MKIKNGFVIKNVGDHNYVVATGELTQTFRNMIRLNGTGRFLWELLARDVSVDELVAKMTEKYDVSAEDARRDVEAFVAALDKNGILEK